MKVAYIAGPYRAKNGKTILDNVREAERVALKYWKLGYAVICPHLNTAFFDGQCPDNVWLDGDLEIVKRVDVVVAMQRYLESSGAISEIDLAKMLDKEIIYDCASPSEAGSSSEDPLQVSAFTDDELRKIKNELDHSNDGYWLTRLLARLEAAEECIGDIEGNRLSWYKKHLNDWRKSKGDSSPGGNAR